MEFASVINLFKLNIILIFNQQNTLDIFATQTFVFKYKVKEWVYYNKKETIIVNIIIWNDETSTACLRLIIVYISNRQWRVSVLIGIVNINRLTARKKYEKNDWFDFLGDNVQAVENLGLWGYDATLHENKVLLRVTKGCYFCTGTQAFERWVIIVLKAHLMIIYLTL